MASISIRAFLSELKETDPLVDPPLMSSDCDGCEMSYHQRNQVMCGTPTSKPLNVHTIDMCSTPQFESPKVDGLCNTLEYISPNNRRSRTPVYNSPDVGGFNRIDSCRKMTDYPRSPNGHWIVPSTELYKSGYGGRRTNRKTNRISSDVRVKINLLPQFNSVK